MVVDALGTMLVDTLEGRGTGHVIVERDDGFIDAAALCPSGAGQPMNGGPCATTAGRVARRWLWGGASDA